MAGGDVGALDGQGALVTGGSRGIGRAFAVRADQGSLDGISGQNLAADGGLLP
jgi:short-subunit dehydrogenase involved in D-alanine esterification of teichoic acids